MTWMGEERSAVEGEGEYGGGCSFILKRWLMVGENTETLVT